MKEAAPLTPPSSHGRSPGSPSGFCSLQLQPQASAQGCPLSPLLSPRPQALPTYPCPWTTLVFSPFVSVYRIYAVLQEASQTCPRVSSYDTQTFLEFLLLSLGGPEATQRWPHTCPSFCSHRPPCLFPNHPSSRLPNHERSSTQPSLFMSLMLNHFSRVRALCVTP